MLATVTWYQLLLDLVEMSQMWTNCSDLDFELFPASNQLRGTRVGDPNFLSLTVCASRFLSTLGLYLLHFAPRVKVHTFPRSSLYKSRSESNFQITREVQVKLSVFFNVTGIPDPYSTFSRDETRIVIEMQNEIQIRIRKLSFWISFPFKFSHKKSLER